MCRGNSGGKRASERILKEFTLIPFCFKKDTQVEMQTCEKIVITALNRRNSNLKL